MNGHLSSGQVSRWMIGEPAAAQEEHARQCPECAATLVGLESAIALFRDSVRDCGEFYGRLRVSAAKAQSVRPYRWASVAAALLLLAAIPMYTSSRERRRAAEMARADAVLLEQVDAEISRAVPASMEPLVKLVSWNSGSETGEIR